MTAEDLDRYEEGKRLARIAVIAQMAAVMQAGDMARLKEETLWAVDPADIAAAATALYDAVEARERTRQQSHTTEDATR